MSGNTDRHGDVDHGGGGGADDGAVHLRVENGVARIHLDRPPVNVLDASGLSELEATLEGVASSGGAPSGAASPGTGAASSSPSGDGGDVRVLCITGRGKAFCAGVAVEDHLPDRVEETLEVFGRVVDRLLGLPFPAVAAVNGTALGGGCELAAACDVVLARAGATLGQPEIRLGVFPPAAAALLPRLVGRQRALDLILTGRSVDAREALHIGLVQHVFPAESYEEDVDEYLAQLSRLSRPVLRMAKRATLKGLERPLDEAVRGAERMYLEDLMELRDPLEGLEAFMEKREPVWEDR